MESQKTTYIPPRPDQTAVAKALADNAARQERDREQNEALGITVRPSPPPQSASESDS